MKLNYAIFLMFIACSFKAALKHGDTFVLRNPSTNKYLSVAHPCKEGLFQKTINIACSSIEETFLQATSRWTIRKCGENGRSEPVEIKLGDKILLENTATGFYIRNSDSKVVEKYLTDQIGSTAPNWEDPDNVILWADSSAAQLTPFKNGTTYTIEGQMPSVGSMSSTDIEAQNKFISEIRNAHCMGNGIKQLSTTLIQTGSGPVTYFLGIDAFNGSLYRQASNSPTTDLVQSRFPLYTIHPRFTNGVIMPKAGSVDCDSLGNVVINDAAYYPSVSAPWRLFVPMVQKADRLVSGGSAPSNIYPHCKADSEIIDQASEANVPPWEFLKSLNPLVKYAKFTKPTALDALQGINHTGNAVELRPVENYFASYPSESLGGVNGQIRITGCKIGKGKIIGRPLGSKDLTWLFIVEDVEKSSDATVFIPKDPYNSSLAIIDYDIDDNGVVWILDRIGNVYHYKAGLSEKGTMALSVENLFENPKKTLLDRPFKLSVASNANNNIAMAIISGAGQLAMGTNGYANDYSGITIKNLSNFSSDKENQLIVGATSASLLVDQNASRADFTIENKVTDPSNNLRHMFLRYGTILRINDLKIGFEDLTNAMVQDIIKMRDQSAPAQVYKATVPDSTVPYVKPTQATPDKVLNSSYLSAEINGFAPLRTNVDTGLSYRVSEWDKHLNCHSKIALWTNNDKNTNAPDYIYASMLQYYSPFIKNLDPNDKSIANQEPPSIPAKGMCYEIAVGIDKTFVLYVLHDDGSNGLYCLFPENQTADKYLSLGLSGRIKEIACANKKNIWALMIPNTNPLKVRDVSKLETYEEAMNLEVGTIKKYDNNTNQWKDIPNLQARSIAASSDGGLWFIDTNGNVKFLTPSGSIDFVPGGGGSNSLVLSSEASSSSSADIKFSRVSAAGSSNDFKLVAITNDKKLYSSDQNRPLEYEGIFGVERASIATNGLCAIKFPSNKTKIEEFYGAGRVYMGWIKGYVPANWPYTTKVSALNIPQNPDLYIEPLPETASNTELQIAYRQALTKGFMLNGYAGWNGGDRTIPAEITDRISHCCNSIAIATNAQGKGFAASSDPAVGGTSYPNMSNRFYKIQDISTGATVLEMTLAQDDPSYTNAWKWGFNGTRRFSIGVDCTACVLWHNSPIISMVMDNGSIARTDISNPSTIPGGVQLISVGNKANIWALSKLNDVFKYSGTFKNWTKIDGIKALAIAGATDGSLWFIDQTTGAKGDLKFRDPTGKISEMPGGKGLNLVKVSAVGDTRNYHLVALDNTGTLFSAYHGNGLTREGISKLKEAVVANNGLCALLFATPTQNPGLMSVKEGFVLIGWTQFAQKPPNWPYPIPRTEYKQLPPLDNSVLEERYRFVEANGFAPIGHFGTDGVQWTRWPKRALHVWGSIALTCELTRGARNRIYKIHNTGDRVIWELPLSPQNLSVINDVNWWPLIRSTNSRQVVASFDGTIATMTEDGKTISVWRDDSSTADGKTHTEPFKITFNPIEVYPNGETKTIAAIRIACGEGNPLSNPTTLKLWALGDNNFIYKYNNNTKTWANIGIQAQDISGGSGDNLYFINIAGNLSFIDAQQRIYDFPNGANKDLLKLSASGPDSSGRFALVAISRANNQLYSAHEGSDGLQVETGFTGICDACVSHNGFCCVMFGASKQLGWTDGFAFGGYVTGKKQANWNPRAVTG